MSASPQYRLRRSCTVAFICMLTCACTGGSPILPSSNQAFIAPGITLTLPDVPDPGRRIEAAQMVMASFEGTNLVFEMRLSAAPGSFSAAAVDALGRRAVTIDWSSSGVRSALAPWLEDRLSVTNMLIDMVLIYWPEDAVRALLAPAGLGLAERPDRRAVLQGSNELIHIEYTSSVERAASGTIRYVNAALGYTITVRSREISE